MGYISSFFGSPRNNYGLQTISTNNSLAPIYEYLVLPTELLDLYMALGGNLTTKKTDEGWIATISSSEKEILSRVDITYPPITFRTFVGKDEDTIKDEAISWFKSKKLDICTVNNWLLKE